LDTLIWDAVIERLANPSLVRAGIDRRLAELRASHPVDVKRDIATKELARIRAGITRLIEAYQEQLISLDELRTRMPSLRHREMAVQSQLAALDAELLDAETYITLAESFEGFLAKLHYAAQSLDVVDRQRVLRLVVKEVQVGPEVVVIRHSIPMPDHHPDPGYLLRTWHHDGRNTQFSGYVEDEHPCPQPVRCVLA
jgi:site-specific DNA recombinase